MLDTLLQNVHTDIGRTHDRQWRDFYAALFGIAAILGFYAVVFDDIQPLWVHHIIFFLPFLISALGIALIWISQRTIDQQRRLAQQIQESNEDERARQILGGPNAQPVDRRIGPILYTIILALGLIIIEILLAALYLSSV